MQRQYFGGKAPKPLEWDPLPYMDEFLLNLEIDERADGYVRMVKVGLSHFARYAKSQGVLHPGQITRDHILGYQAYLMKEVKKENGDPLGLAYRQQLMKYLRSWVNWLEETHKISSSPWVRIKVGSVGKKPNPIEDEELELLFQAHRRQAFSIDPFMFHRRDVILALLYGWGLRIHELHYLNVTNMDMRLDYVTVRNKGGRTKQLPYAEVLKDAVQRWLVQRAKYAKLGEDALLIDMNGNRLSIQMIRKIVTELGQNSGVHVNPHRLRDTFGTTMLDNDVEVERIMKMMGHTQRSQTLAYARVNDHKVKESHDKVMNPLLHKLLG